jgi:hypothetical protein
MPVPAEPKIYHIIHVDRLRAVVKARGLLSDARIAHKKPAGTTIGMKDIKRRRLKELRLDSHPDLFVGDCVPFYFCPRSVMLYVISRANHSELSYRGGQGSIVHLQADLRSTVAWADRKGRRWAFTLGNAGARYFKDRSDLGQLGEIDWCAVHAKNWRARKEGKQAEFLIERKFPWKLVSRIGVFSREMYDRTQRALRKAAHRPSVQVRREWYY